MKNRTLPVKRRPAPKGLLKRLSAVTRRKQRVSASATVAETDVGDSSSRISRALTIIFMIHIVAIGLIFFHQNFLDGRTVETEEVAADASIVVTPAAAVRSGLPRLSSGDTAYIVKAGDNYARIAAAHEVDEAELRFVNKHVEIQPHLILSIPPKRIVAVDPPEVAALRGGTDRERGDGLVEAVPVDVSNAPRAQLVRPNVTPGGSASGESHVVQPGDTLWKISTRFNVSADALQKANDISDPRKMKIGMKLKIPR